jgi:creatinine amidohydrolase
MNEFERDRERIRTLILPCGALEQHGPHLPLGTDVLHPVAVANAVAERAPVWAAPPLWYGVCKSTFEHPGTVGVRLATLQATVRDLVTGFYRQGMRHIVVFSGHAGGTHMAALVDAGDELVRELPELALAVLSVLDLGKTAWKGIQQVPEDSHAGEVETSIVQHLHPDLVQGTAPEEYPSFPAHILTRNKRRHWPCGVWGDPGAASPEKGRALFEASVSGMIDLIENLKQTAESDR